MKRTIGVLVLAGTLALSGCSKDHSQYRYDDKIGEDHVTFTEEKFTIGADDNILTVRKPDGRTIKYIDRRGENLKLEGVEFTNDGETTRYTANDEVGKPILEEAQKQFDVYLERILEIKTEQGLENLK